MNHKYIEDIFIGLILITIIWFIIYSNNNIDNFNSSVISIPIKIGKSEQLNHMSKSEQLNQTNQIIVNHSLDDTIKTNPNNYSDLDVYEEGKYICYKKNQDKLVIQPVTESKPMIQQIYPGLSYCPATMGTMLQKPFEIAEKCNNLTNNDKIMPYDEYYFSEHQEEKDPADYYKKIKPIVGELENKTIRGFNYGEFDNVSKIDRIGNIALLNKELPKPVGIGYVFKDNPGM